MELKLVLFIYSIGILVCSLVGGLVPLLVRLSHRQVQISVSFVAGMILGIAVFHLLPHAILDAKNVKDVSYGILFGLLAMFFLERFFCYHHHDSVADGDSSASKSCSHSHSHSNCSHGESSTNSGEKATEKATHGGHALAWGGVVVGLGVHSLLNGLALAASAQSAWNSPGVVWPGLAVFLAISLHKPFDALTIGTLMATGGESLKRRLLVNTLFALVVPLGMLLFYCGLNFVEFQQQYVGFILSFSVGIFLFLALSDLLPELQFHSHDRGLLSFCLILGVVLAWSIAQIDHGHHEQGYILNAN